MGLIDDLKKVIKSTKTASRKWTYEEFPDPWEIGDSIKLSDYTKGTPLEEFENKIKSILDATKYEYKLDLVSAVACGDVIYKIDYVLVWYDTKLNYKKITYEIE